MIDGHLILIRAVIWANRNECDVPIRISNMKMYFYKLCLSESDWETYLYCIPTFKFLLIFASAKAKINILASFWYFPSISFPMTAFLQYTLKRFHNCGEGQVLLFTFINHGQDFSYKRDWLCSVGCVFQLPLDRQWTRKAGCCPL